MNSYGQRRPKTRRLSKKILLAFALLLAIGLVEMAAIALKLNDRYSSHKSSRASDSNAQDSSTPPFDKSKYPTDKASSIWVVVNKGRRLPPGYAPSLAVPNVPLRLGAGADESHLSTAAAGAMEKMFAAAAKAGLPLKIASGYRSYGSQTAIFAAEVKAYGLARAESESARPGHSEHQTGLAADLEPSDRRCEIADCFAGTPEGKWLAKNSYKYGFILRYPKGKENLTGYIYEPWHFRYVGNELAAQINKTGQTLEQFFGLPAYTSYPANSLSLK